MAWGGAGVATRVGAEAEVERLEAEVKGLEQIKKDFGVKVEENKLLCENSFFR